MFPLETGTWTRSMAVLSTRILGCHSALLSLLPSGYLRYCSECGQKSIFFPKKLLTGQTANKVSYISFVVLFYEPLRFYICATFCELRKAIQLLLCIFSGLHNLELNSEMRKLFFGVRARRAILIGLTGHHLLIHYRVLFKVYDVYNRPRLILTVNI